MGEMQKALGMLAVGFSTAISKVTAEGCAWYGKYVIKGRVPLACTHEKLTLSGIQHNSNCFDTEADAVTALLACGVDRFQMADCSWYSKD